MRLHSQVVEVDRVVVEQEGRRVVDGGHLVVHRKKERRECVAIYLDIVGRQKNRYREGL
jgi:hypothetical protein